MNDASEIQEKEATEEKTVVIAPSGKIAITTYDKQNVIVFLFQDSHYLIPI